ncbi:MAG: DNA repair protein RecO [Chloroflexi bacterium]|nr:DNA repair protein RecO [Chloroflexota bacterium]
MPAPRTYRTPGIVLSRFDLGEADRVLTILTPHEGKLRVIAKGVRRPGSRIGGTVEPFAEIQLLLARGRTFDVVTQAQVSEAWLRLRDHLGSTATAWYIGELAERAVEERAGAYPVYALLRRAFQLLDDGMSPDRVARWYEMELADALGVRPEVERCVECDRVPDELERFRWAPGLGGLLCERHPPPPAEVSDLSLGALKVLRAYRRLDIEAIAAFRLPVAVEAEVERLMRRFVRHVLDREARSLAFLDEIRG